MPGREAVGRAPWRNHDTDTEVTDPETIARLEQDEPPEGDEASINRPGDLDKLDPELRKKLETRSRSRNSRSTPSA